MPNKGSFTVHFNEQEVSSLVIYNVAGQKVYKETFENKRSNKSLSVSQNFAPGIYLLLTTDIKGNTTSTKFLVN
ncbi:T9SS type A sorting domain-containing protein [Flavivirga amylovorans]|uniref:T9SS type A sorting domain-containing protein n=1 Tax=Flavivirga amylovorans TaxID=870486 RepID=A0ABT8WW54_9FLAO|nr:T9SS type A sorting domain-containing protein [Flavivirga amylovorans]MDO5985922.1 T9SS type A sorting domain-containing protein [Flavivirga amylovorans]